MLAQFPLAHTEVVTSLTFSPHINNTGTAGSGLLCSTSGDDTAALWDIRGGVNATRLVNHHRGPVNHALFLPDDPNVLLTAADDRTVAMWDLRRADRPLGQLTGFTDGVNKMVLLSADAFPNCNMPSSGGGGGQHLVASACDDGRVYVHDLVPFGANDANSSSNDPNVNSNSANSDNTNMAPLPSCGALVDRFWASTSTVNDIILAPNNPRVLVTASEDGALRSWRLLFDVNAGTEDRLLGSLDEFENPVNHVAFVPQGMLVEPDDAADDGTAILSGGGGGGGGDEDEEGAGGGGGDIAASAAAAVTGMIATTTTTTVTVAAAAAAAAAALRHRRDEERLGLRRWVLAACSEFIFGTDLCLPSGEFGGGERGFVGHSDYVRGLEFTRQGTLLTVSDDGTVIEWSMKGASCGEPIRQVKLHDGFVMAAGQNTAGDALATGDNDGNIRIWRLPFATETMTGCGGGACC